MRLRNILLFASLLTLLTLVACAPKTFIRTMEPTWATVELRQDLAYDRAWDTVVDTLVKRFDLEVLQKGDGYMRTNWLYSWTGRMNENYRVRVTAKFSPDHTKIELKTEAEYRSPGGWVVGYDSRLLSTIKSDIMGTVGRTTR